MQDQVDDRLPEEIYTSLYIQQSMTDYIIVIRPPVIEYTIPSKSFLFMKTLTREENNEFLGNKFIDWSDQAIKTLMRYNKFNELLQMTEKNINYYVHLKR